MSTSSFTAVVDRMPALRREVAADPGAHRVLTGERPTGPLHLGHLAGSIVERVRLQRSGVQVLVVLADYQVITDRENAGRVRDHVRGAVLDLLAAGLDPDRTTIFTHSAVPALNQLMLPFLSLVTEAELHRNPTVKAEHRASGRALSGLLLTYPVHQAADILCCRADLVPVGKDNLPHVELTRVIARRFAERYAPVFVAPEPMVTDSPEVPGLDGRKMSKSYGNAVELGATAEETAALIRRTRTDAERRITYDPVARPGVAGLLSAAAFCTGRTPDDIAAEIGDGGSARLKRFTAEAVNAGLAGHRARRAELAAEPGLAESVLARGNATANALAGATLAEVRTAMGMDYRDLTSGAVSPARCAGR
ncbi:tryptophan--tRNA ligase [Pseudonocardia sp. HH130630-07]|uniref:tryptophan--tRNA ligase n=1 Tax=Pseudonocardia sp. HH130630-07 TaxID=1690815 RepID=UPI000AFE61EB|nr:tryptophan--tRNA ligase [Pseudonocardia sp. HH130630-07]